jgi:pimeloyl-ACP methyl ester carboxylesterase
MFADFTMPFTAHAAPPELEVLHTPAQSQTVSRETPVVLVHGAFVGAWCYQAHWLAYFARQGFRCYAPSLRGHGNSEGRAQLDYAGIGEYVSDIARVVEHLSGPAPILVGHSMGALVVQRYLEQYPASAAILLAPVPPHGLMASSWRMALGDPLLFARFGLMQSLGAAQVDTDMARRAVFSERVANADIAYYSQLIQRESQRALWEMNVFASGRPWRVPNRPPMRVISAAEDALFANAETQAVARLWQADSITMPHMGHAMMLEPDWQDVGDDITRWLWSQGIR